MRMYGLKGRRHVWIEGIICPSAVAEVLAGSNHMRGAFNQGMANQSVTVISLQASFIFQQIHN